MAAQGNRAKPSGLSFCCPARQATGESNRCCFYSKATPETLLEAVGKDARACPESPKAASKFYISSLKMYISNLDMYISNLKIYISRLEM